MLVTTGGASEGEHDLVMAGLAQRGLQVDFWKIAMRPGKPLMFGDLGPVPVPVLGLPGNPVSALVCSILFLLPALGKLTGGAGDPPPTIQATLGAPGKANDQRADHLRATMTFDAEGSALVTPFGAQDSSMLRRFALADALVLRAPHAPALPAGAPVRAIRLDAIGV
jgi:molybdopterin molybdotransferase